MTDISGFDIQVGGMPGPAGADGYTLLSGTIDPSSGVGKNGDWYVNGTALTIFGPKAGGTWPAGVALSTALIAAAFKAIAPAGFVLGWADAFNRFIVALRASGAIVFSSIESKGPASLPSITNVSSINGQPIGSYLNAANYPDPVLDAEINLFTLYGQSRSSGTLAYPVLTTSQNYDGLRFNDDVRPYDQATPTRSSLVALIESDKPGTPHLGETPASGMEATIKQRLVAENGIAYADRPYQMLMSCEGVSGTPMSGLKVGSTYYNWIKLDIDAMRTLAQAANKSSKFRGFSWSQGESDYSANTPASSYRTDLTAILAGLDAYAKAANPNNGDVVCLMDQVFGHATYGHANDPYLALEQLAISEDTPHFYMVGSLAHLATADGIHPINTSAQHMGAYFARAYKKVVIEKGTWSPLKPVDWSRDGKVVTLRFKPESGQLAIDTTTVAAQTNYGFTLVDSGGSALTISSVALVGKDTVKIVAAATVPAGAKIRAGFGAGGKTNLRDTMGDTVTATISGNIYKLHNWCVIFEKVL